MKEALSSRHFIRIKIFASSFFIVCFLRPCTWTESHVFYRVILQIFVPVVWSAVENALGKKIQLLCASVWIFHIKSIFLIDE